MTLNFLAMGAAGFGWGALSDRIGPRGVVLVGSLLLGLGLFHASRARTPLMFQIAVGAGRHRRRQLLHADDRRGHGLDHRASRPRGLRRRGMVSSLGMALGPALGGWVFDAFGRYTWMYIGSAAVGHGAVAIALAFPPLGARPATRLKAA